MPDIQSRLRRQQLRLSKRDYEIQSKYVSESLSKYRDSVHINQEEEVGRGREHGE